MSSKIFFKQLILFCLVFITTINAQDIQEENGHYRFTISKSFDVDPGGRLEVNNISGNIRVITWDKKSVSIRDRIRLDVFTGEEAREVAERIKDGYSSIGNTVSINGRGGWHHHDRNLEITVPPKFDIDIHTSNGNIFASNLEGFVDLKTSNGNIDLQAIHGEVDVKTSAGNLILENIRGRIEGKTSGGNIQLRDIYELVDVRTSGGNIRVVNAKKDINVRTSGGRISVRQAGGNINAKTSGGSVEVEDCSGEANLRTSGGDIEAINIGNRLEMKTSGGDVLARNVNGTVIAQTSGGDLELEDIRGAVRAETSAGDVDVEITLKDYKKDHRVFLRTNTGTIKLTLPGDFPASISAEIRDAGRRWNRHEIYSDFPLSQKEASNRRVLRRIGDINGGGDEVILEASHGDIHIFKNNR